MDVQKYGRYPQRDLDEERALDAGEFVGNFMRIARKMW